MGFQISNTPSASAPNIEGGLVPARLIGLAAVNKPEWAKENGKFGPDNGDRWHWRFVVVDDEDAVLYNEDGDPVEVDAYNSATMNTKSDKSKNAAWLKAVSPAAFAAVDNAQQFDAGILVNSPCMLLLETKENGWPTIKNVLPRPTRRAKKAAQPTIDEDEE